MYFTGRPLMPPLSLTQSKYAFATLPIVEKSTPGMTMAIPPILIGAPVAFLPVPLPHTLFDAEGVPEPTGPAAPALPVDTATASRASRASRQPAKIAPPSFLDLIAFLLGRSRSGLARVCRGSTSCGGRLQRAPQAPPKRALVQTSPLVEQCVGHEP